MSEKYNKNNILRKPLQTLLLVGALMLMLAQMARADDNWHKPALWKASLGESTVYFFGTFHLLRPEVNWMTPELESVLDQLTTLTFEADNRQMNERTLSFLIQQVGVYRRGSIKDVLPPETYAYYAKSWTNLGLPDTHKDRIKPWYAAIMLATQSLQANGYDGNAGVESVLTREAEERGIPIRGLEMAMDQLKTFSDQDEEWQVKFLEKTMADMDTSVETVDEMQVAWLSGDEAVMNEKLVKPLLAEPVLYESLLIKRNRNWLAGIEQLFRTPGTHMVAVGTSHLIGQYSVINMLKQKGYRIERF